MSMNVQPAVPTTAIDNSASCVWRKFLAFLLPPVGLVLYLTNRKTHPAHARNAGTGALYGAVPLLALSLGAFLHERDEAMECHSRLMRLNFAVMQYIAEHPRHTFPDLSTPQAVQAALGTYVDSADILRCPGGHAYFGNIALRGKRFSAVGNKKHTAMLTESAHSHLWGRNIVYADGHTEWHR